MKKQLAIPVLLTLFTIACSPSAKFNKDRIAFEAATVKTTFKSVANMNDAYFVVKENNFFEFYRQLFDSVKNSSFPGKFSYKGDTMVLKFYDKKGLKLLGSKAVINAEKHVILFYK